MTLAFPLPLISPYPKITLWRWELGDDLGGRKSFTHPQNHKQIGYYDLTLPPTPNLPVVALGAFKALRGAKSG